MNNDKLHLLYGRGKNRLATASGALALLALLLVLAWPTHQAAAQADKFRLTTNPIPGQYIVVFNNAAVTTAGVGTAVTDLTRVHGGTVSRTYSAALRGFALRSTDAAARALSLDARVEYVIQDGYAQLSAVTTQNNPPSWGLTRIDQRDRPLDTKYGYSSRGEGVNVYVIDSGINFSHQDFGGRASLGADFIGDGRNGGDCQGHGTHVAGTIGGASHGVAKGANLRSVRVFGCAGPSPFSIIIAGVDWVTSNRVLPAVANMSLEGQVFIPLDTAVSNSIASGVTYVVAAGNGNVNASNISPARVAAAITVAATDIFDARAIFNATQASNFGSVVDLFAPGKDITSTWYTSNSATAILSGTSMAAPHVAGVAAQFLQINKAATPTAVASAIITQTTNNRVSDPQGSPNRLLFSDFMDAVSVNAASFSAVHGLAADSIVAVFGYALATTTQTASGAAGPSAANLPLTLGGTTVKVRDSNNVERDAPLFFVSPGQVNYVTPTGTANGAAVVTITSGNGSKTLGPATIATVGPGVFAANSNGQGILSGYVFRIAANGAQTYEAIFQFNPATGQNVALPINLGPPGDQVFLIIQATGFRYRSSLSAVTCILGGLAHNVLSVGPAPGLVGVDQINVGPISRSLIGSGVRNVVLTAEGKTANTVTVTIQ